jgi:OmpA-OmpF porin, OOP family
MNYMMRCIFGAAVLLALLASTAEAQTTRRTTTTATDTRDTRADNRTRWGNGNMYGSLSGSANWLNDIDSNNTATGETGDIDADLGWGANAALGYMLPAWGDFRFELEGGYKQYGLDDVASSIGGTVNPDGDFRIYSYMANLYYDLRNMHSWFNASSHWVPFIGAGLGGAYLRMPRNIGLGATDDNDNVFAYQAMAGIGYVPENSRTEWYVGYRYFGTQEPEFDTAGGSIDLDHLRSNNVELGMRYHF